MASTQEALQLLCGVVSPEAYAARHGLSLQATLALRDRGLARFDQALHPRRSRSKWALAAIAGLALVLVPTGALAQLVTFAANTPAVASQVNANFTQLKTWLEQKVGTVGTNTITTGALTVTGATTLATVSTGNLSSSGTLSSTGNLSTGGTLTVAGASSLKAVTATTLNATDLTLTGVFTTTGTNPSSINGITLRKKTGNNGTTSCDQYCLNSAYLSWAGSCLGAKLPSGQFTADCGFVPGVLPAGQELLCLCATY